MYYLIFMEEDGFQIERFQNTQALSSYIQDNFGNRKISFVSDFNEYYGRYMSDEQLIVIKGDVLTPTPVTIVKSWEF